MDRTRFLGMAERYAGPIAEEGMRSSAKFYIVRNGKRELHKQANEVFDESGNKRLSVNLRALDCGHVVDDPTRIVALNGSLFCERCVVRCPVCGDHITPGIAITEQVEGTWFHGACASDARMHFNVKRRAEQIVLVERARAARLQSELTDAQIEAAHEGMALQRERFYLEERREEKQRAMLEAQIESTYHAMGMQDERFAFEKSHAAERLELDKAADRRQARALGSQLEGEEQRRRLEEGRARLEAAERLAKLAESGYMPRRRVRRELP